ncbi:MAG TPA: hypothetical protein VII59_05830, partial [Streptosporangiaceae bacterium]
MTDDQLPATWIGGQAVVQFPESADALTAGQARELMLRLMNQGAAALIADMTSTVWCDRSIADALLSAYHRASAGGIVSVCVGMAALSRSGSASAWRLRERAGSPSPSSRT